MLQKHFDYIPKEGGGGNADGLTQIRIKPALPTDPGTLGAIILIRVAIIYAKTLR